MYSILVKLHFTNKHWSSQTVQEEVEKWTRLEPDVSTLYSPCDLKYII